MPPTPRQPGRLDPRSARRALNQRRNARFTLYILAATAGLAVLLYVVLQLIPALPTVPPDRAPAGVAAPNPARVAPDRPAASASEPLAPPSGLPRIAGYADLAEFLDARGLDAGSLLRQSRDWYESRGFFGANPLYGVEFDDARERYYESLDADTLRSLTEAGEIGATQALAARFVVVEPGASLVLYQRAAAMGSIYALLQIATMLDTFSRLEGLSPESGDRLPALLNQLQQSRPGVGLREQSFAHALAAIRDGGPAVASPEMLAWIEKLAEDLGPDRLEPACRLSSGLLVGVSGSRRAVGVAPVNVSPPAVFLAVPDLYARLPCGETTDPVVPVMDLSRCGYQAVTDERGRARELWVCP